jgi:hypothetical protein
LLKPGSVYKNKETDAIDQQTISSILNPGSSGNSFGFANFPAFVPDVARVPHRHPLFPDLIKLISLLCSSENRSDLCKNKYKRFKKNLPTWDPMSKVSRVASVAKIKILYLSKYTEIIL